MAFDSDRSGAWLVCAAVKYPCGFIAVGPRHFDPIMRAVTPISVKESHGKAVQGFIDQRGKFYDRHEAWTLAQVNGQVRFRCGGDEINGGMLFSENLY